MKLLMPVDRSSFSETAVDFVASRARFMAAPPEVELVNVQHPLPMRVVRAGGKEMVQAHHDAEAASILDPAVARLASVGIQASQTCKVGSVHHELAVIVDEHPADLVVMASHGESGVTRFLLGSVANVVALACTKPLLILRGTAPADESLKIVIALDGSPHGLSVARFIAQHREFLGASPDIVLVHVAPDLSHVVVPGWRPRVVDTGIDPAQARVMQEAAFSAAFEPARGILSAAGLQAREDRLVGSDPAEAIAAYVREMRPDILAMGSIGFGTHRIPSLGSVASRVAAHTDTSLLLVREG